MKQKRTNNTIKRVAAFGALAVMIVALGFVPFAAAQDAAPSQMLFTNVNVFDGVNAQRIENANVLVEGNLIKEISTSTPPGTRATAARKRGSG